MIASFILVMFFCSLLFFVLPFGVMAAQQTSSQHEQTATIGIGLVGLLKFVSPFFAFAFSAALSIALFPPKTKMQMFGLLACCAGSYFFVGAFVIDYYQLQHYTAESRDGIKFFCAVPSWMIWQIVAVILTKLRDDKDPLSKITSYVKKIKSLK